MTAQPGQKRYRSYICNPDIPIPKTSTWRYNKRKSKTDDDYDNNDEAEIDRSLSKRKAYLHDGNNPIPRQTLWYWKKIGIYI